MVRLRLGFAKGQEAGFGLVYRSISAGEQVACVAKNCPPESGQIGSRAIHAAKTYTSSNTHGSNAKAALPELLAKPACSKAVVSISNIVCLSCVAHTCIDKEGTYVDLIHILYVVCDLLMDK